MHETRLTSEQVVFLRRTANILASSSWGAEHYRAQISAIAEIERLQHENTILSQFVPAGYNPAKCPPLDSLVNLVRTA